MEFMKKFLKRNSLTKSLYYFQKSLKCPLQFYIVFKSWPLPSPCPSPALNWRSPMMADLKLSEPCANISHFLFGNIRIAFLKHLELTSSHLFCFYQWNVSGNGISYVGQGIKLPVLSYATLSSWLSIMEVWMRSFAEPPWGGQFPWRVFLKGFQ